MSAKYQYKIFMLKCVVNGDSFYRCVTRKSILLFALFALYAIWMIVIACGINLLSAMIQAVFENLNNCVYFSTLWNNYLHVAT
jgi:hypothetical protein